MTVHRQFYYNFIYWSHLFSSQDNDKATDPLKLDSLLDKYRQKLALSSKEAHQAQLEIKAMKAALNTSDLSVDSQIQEEFNSVKRKV